MRDQQRLRHRMSGAGFPIALASLILSVTLSASAQNREEDTKDFQPPELLYLTWQELNPRAPGGKHFPVWKPDGELLSDEEARKLRKEVQGFAVFNLNEQQQHPLILIFKVDPQLKSSPVMSTFLTEGGTRSIRGGSLNEPRNGMILASLSPSRDALLLWPEKATVEVRFPLEKPTVVKTLEGQPEGQVDVAQGVTWKLDPDYAWKTDPKTGRIVRAENKLTGLLITNPNEADPNVDYEVQIEVRGGKLLDSSILATLKSNPVGRPSRLDISELVDNPQQITNLFIVRQRHAVKTLKDLPIKRDLLFKALQQDESDE